ncbi:hypothetical protein RRG08_041953 [Elysia crispata]|uniref:Uncharacterized protein n=1 Tax=Elysia crispata TaxID=231223 RepID=A0AAE1CNL0_9GAST|nr:hypothetical protein RRG08_041953 [Elysia crispata]
MISLSLFSPGERQVFPPALTELILASSRTVSKYRVDLQIISIDLRQKRGSTEQDPRCSRTRRSAGATPCPGGSRPGIEGAATVDMRLGKDASAYILDINLSCQRE